MRTIQDIQNTLLGGKPLAKQYAKVASQVILNLMPDEDMEYIVFGYQAYQNERSLGHDSIFAMTNKRVLLGAREPDIFSKFPVITFNYDQIQNVYAGKRGPLSGRINIDTNVHQLAFEVISNYQAQIAQEINRRFTEKKSAMNEMTREPQITSAADEILKFKQLLDAGIITSEEFEAKKKQLLGL